MEIIKITPSPTNLRKNIRKVIFATALATSTLTLTSCKDKNANKELQQVMLQKYKNQYNLSKSNWIKKYTDDVLVVESDQEIQTTTFDEVLKILDGDLVKLEVKSGNSLKNSKQFINNNPAVIDSIRNRFLYELIMQPIDASSKYTSQVQINVNKNVVTIQENNQQVIAIIPTDDTSLSDIIKSYSTQSDDNVTKMKNLYTSIKDIEDTGYYYGSKIYTQNEGIATNKELDYYTLKSINNKKVTK